MIGFEKYKGYKTVLIALVFFSCSKKNDYYNMDSFRSSYNGNNKEGSTILNLSQSSNCNIRAFEESSKFKKQKDLSEPKIRAINALAGNSSEKIRSITYKNKEDSLKKMLQNAKEIEGLLRDEETVVSPLKNKNRKEEEAGAYSTNKGSGNLNSQNLLELLKMTEAMSTEIFRLKSKVSKLENDKNKSEYNPYSKKEEAQSLLSYLSHDCRENHSDKFQNTLETYLPDSKGKISPNISSENFKESQKIEYPYRSSSDFDAGRSSSNIPYRSQNKKSTSDFRRAPDGPSGLQMEPKQFYGPPYGSSYREDDCRNSSRFVHGQKFEQTRRQKSLTSNDKKGLTLTVLENNKKSDRGEKDFKIKNYLMKKGVQVDDKNNATRECEIEFCALRIKY